MLERQIVRCPKQSKARQGKARQGKLRKVTAKLPQRQRLNNPFFNHSRKFLNLVRM